jgi:large subunit ribosomal protein L23
MPRKSPYQIIKHEYVTEKSVMLKGLKNAESNPSLKRCRSPKYVFVVDRSANKREIAQAVEDIYKEQGIKVEAVNTIQVKPKLKRHRARRGKAGFTTAFKKAIVTLRPKDSLDNL